MNNGNKLKPRKKERNNGRKRSKRGVSLIDRIVLKDKMKKERKKETEKERKNRKFK